MPNTRHVRVLRFWLACLMVLVCAWLWPDGLLAVVPMLFMPPLFGVPCSCCSGSAAQTYQVDLSGFTNGTCTACASYNRSYVVANGILAWRGVTCMWFLEFADLYCDCTGFSGYCDIVLFSLTRVGSDVDAKVEITDSAFGSTRMVWKNAAVTPDPDCTPFSSYSVAFSSKPSFPCTHDGSAALVTAL